jgi:hypothetical protein
VERVEAGKSKGEVYEGIAFQFCKIATVALIAGRFALPVAAGCCAVFYALALAKGKRDTRCVLRYPLVLIVVWGGIAGWSMYSLTRTQVQPPRSPGSSASASAPLRGV